MPDDIDFRPEWQLVSQVEQTQAWLQLSCVRVGRSQSNHAEPTHINLPTLAYKVCAVNSFNPGNHHC